MASYSLLAQGTSIDQPDGGGNGVICDPSQSGINLGDCVLLNESQTVGTVYDQPSVLVNLFIRNAFVVAGVIIFALIIYAGYLFIQAGEKGKEQAKTIAESALIGFILMFSAYWIIQILEIITGQTLLF